MWQTNSNANITSLAEAIKTLIKSRSEMDLQHLSLNPKKTEDKSHE